MKFSECIKKPFDTNKMFNIRFSENGRRWTERVCAKSAKQAVTALRSGIQDHISIIRVRVARW